MLFEWHQATEKSSEEIHELNRLEAMGEKPMDEIQSSVPPQWKVFPSEWIYQLVFKFNWFRLVTFSKIIETMTI